MDKKRRILKKKFNLVSPDYPETGFGYQIQNNKYVAMLDEMAPDADTFTWDPSGLMKLQEWISSNYPQANPSAMIVCILSHLTSSLFRTLHSSIFKKTKETVAGALSATERAGSKKIPKV